MISDDQDQAQKVNRHNLLLLELKKAHLVDKWSGAE